MAYGKLFIQTGQTPPRGFVVDASLDRPSENNRKQNGATVFVYGSPYRRVYRESNDSLYVIVNGQKMPCFIASENY